jgi:hypothetical protein
VFWFIDRPITYWANGKLTWNQGVHAEIIRRRANSPGPSIQVDGLIAPDRDTLGPVIDQQATMTEAEDQSIAFNVSTLLEARVTCDDPAQRNRSVLRTEKSLIGGGRRG